MNLVNFAGTLAAPSKVVCIGRNYVAHVEELGNVVPEEMVVFFKPNAAISETLQAEHLEPLQYEAEICFGIENGSFAYVGCGFDLTKRGLQQTLIAKGLPWERCKSFKGSALFSGFVPFDGDFEGLEVELRIDGQLAQRGGVEQMIHKPMAILEELGGFTELENFDIVMTGTPKGVGFLKSGSRYEGVLRRKGEELASFAWLAV